MSIYHHFRPEEKPLVDRTIEWTELVNQRFQPKLTSFLDPREQFIVQSIVSRTVDVHISFFGGYAQSERKRAIIVPNFVEVSPHDFRVTLLSIEGNQKTLPLEHRDVLGSLLGLGIKRDKFGDILLSEEKNQIIVAEEVADYVMLHLQQINKYEVRCESIDWSELQAPSEGWEFKDTTVSSLRLDVILSELLPLSRSKSVPLIKTGKVKINWKVVEHPSVSLEEGDVLSVKGFGRFLFSKVEGLTKKQKYRVQLGKKKKE
jgi:RNA-binding protein YlmH